MHLAERAKIAVICFTVQVIGRMEWAGAGQKSGQGQETAILRAQRGRNGIVKIAVV